MTAVSINVIFSISHFECIHDSNDDDDDDE